MSLQTLSPYGSSLHFPGHPLTHWLATCILSCTRRLGLQPSGLCSIGRSGVLCTLYTLIMTEGEAFISMLDTYLFFVLFLLKVLNFTTNLLIFP